MALKYFGIGCYIQAGRNENAKDEKEEHGIEQEEIQKPGLFSSLNWIHPCITPDC